jgi:hypothetical protein
MKSQALKIIGRTIAVTLLAMGIKPGSALAEVDWFAFTMDNDALAGNDSGYTNGLYFTWVDTPDNEKPEIGLLARAMRWSLPADGGSGFGVSLGTVGQIMVTPEDIEEDPPILPPNDLPYAGMLFYADTYIRVQERYADRIAVTLGVVGEYSFAEEAQKFVHEVIDSAEPCCWDEQLDDEVVFQVSRARVWRSWVAGSGNMDLLLGADLSLGTISSTAGVSAMFRYGRQMERTYASAMLIGSRTLNPIATQTGWYLFAATRAGYLANHIFLDGSKSYDDDFDEIEYDEERLLVSLGLAYSWKEFALTFAMNDLHANEDSDNDAAQEYSEYGTLTLAWQLD